MRFNSIKVRLEQPRKSKMKMHVHEFQFHKGTIRTQGTHNGGGGDVRFNSIKVRLERYISHDRRRAHGFNSIKVRLELQIKPISTQKLYSFNSIKVRLELTSDSFRRVFPRFQFHKGTIRTMRMSAKPPLLPSVSIP